MPKNERTTDKVATLAGKVLAGTVKPTPAQVKTLAGSALTQTSDKKRK